MSVSPNRTQLHAAELIRLAQRDSGVFGVVDQALLPRVTRFVEWITARGPYGEDEIARMRRTTVRVLSARLRLALDRKRIPAIAAEKIERPIFVVGLPRTGTTLLHALLAEDPAVHAPRAWHVHSPTPPPGVEGPCAGRLGIARRAIERLIDTVPGLLPLHPYWDHLEHTLIEDEEIFALDFRNAYPSQFLDIPTLDVDVDAAGGDMRGTYAFHREFLQYMQWNTGRRRWACKGVYHQFVLDSLFEAYPDAICVWPHRSMTDVHTSTVTIAAVLFDAINGGTIDWREYARTTALGIKAGLDHVMASPVVDDPRVVHVRFDAIAKDPVGVVRSVYERAALPFESEHERRMRAWLASPANRVDRYGRYPYDPASFGFTNDWIRELFADYHRRFGLDGPGGTHA